MGGRGWEDFFEPALDFLWFQGAVFLGKRH